MKKRIKKPEFRPMKKKFVVGERETLDNCLERMKREGYEPLTRIERPIFREEKSGPVCIGRECILEGRLNKPKGEQ